MKKNALLMTIACVMGGLTATSAFAIDGNINFTGEVIDTTCLINGQTPNGAVNVDVDLKQVQVGALNFAGATANATPFKITLGGDTDTNCTNGKIAEVYFEPTSPAIDRTTGWLKNTAPAASNPAQNVQVQILNGETNSPINLFSGNNNYAPKTIANHTAEYSYFGQYIAVNGPATSGPVASTVKYSIVYQ
ncbi:MULTISPECIES: fimbrial protein [unclassified Serratia (in: enterobacteria)]|uniref:fimbrial protein n=1 Tax=unclassified Serratia (in: enterobacteria) TaxID=2647522 RepID=UPI00068C416C|nr:MULTISPECIES: fimbrial protein [unclassified Serratia (in: enterobacteria)]